MEAQTLIDALSIPAEARVDRKIPKKMLLEQDVPTAADKKQIQNGIEEINWIAALKPNTIGVPIYKDTIREYLEIAVVSLMLRTSAKPTRIVELIHRLIPYPLILIDILEEDTALSLAHKRRSLGESGKVVVEDIVRVSLHSPAIVGTGEAQFLEGLALSRLPGKDLYTLYQGLIGLATALEAFRITETYRVTETSEQVTVIRETLEKYSHLRQDIDSLRAQAEKEKQISRRVKLNLRIKQLEDELTDTRKTL